MHICLYVRTVLLDVGMEFVLPDVLSAFFSYIQLLDVVLSLLHFCTALTETLNMILSQKL